MDHSTVPNSTATRLNAVFLPLCCAIVIMAMYVPLRQLFRVKKLAACTLVIVIGVQNTFTFINAIIWPNNNTTDWWSGVGYCDFQIAIKVPLSTLLATSSACVSWDLAKALDTDNPRLFETKKSRRRRLAGELFFCFGIPVLETALHYVIQANRYAVTTVYGCADSIDDSWPSIVIVAIWPPIFAIMDCYFAGKISFVS